MTGFTGVVTDGTCGLGDCDGDCITTFGVPTWLAGVGVTEGEEVIFPFGGDAFAGPFGGVVPDRGVFIIPVLADPLAVKGGLTGVTGVVGGSSYFCNCSR